MDITADSIDQANPLLDLICDKFQKKQITLETPQVEDMGDASIEVDEQGWSMTSVSLGSSEMGGNIDPNNINTDGGVMTDREKVLGWSLPSVNSSLLLEKSMAKFQKSLGVEIKSNDKGSNEDDIPLTHSTPVSTSHKRKTRVPKKPTNTKNTTLAMLKDLEI